MTPDFIAGKVGSNVKIFIIPEHFCAGDKTRKRHVAALDIQKFIGIRCVLPELSLIHILNLVENSYKNIARMRGYARKYHAEGVLNTDWGDCGHINQPDFSLPGMIYGAVFSWGDDTDSFEELNEQISRLAYGDRSGKFVSYMAKTAECSIFDWWDANVVYEEKVLGHPNNRNAPVSYTHL